MHNIQDILKKIENGEISAEEAFEEVKNSGTADLGFAMIDHDRKKRCGFPEVVFGEGKEADHIKKILIELFNKNGYALATRVSCEKFTEIKDCLPEADYNKKARTLLAGKLPPAADDIPEILVIAAGTSDLPVAEEAVIAARYAGVKVETLYDAGVAGIHRLLGAGDRLNKAGAIVVAAGMEGALPSVVGGLVSCPVVAVPTSVGYGASFGGIAALLGMLNSCASGVAVVNIDNGFGAGILAARIVLGYRRQK
ncbi:MAG: nickel pincer cofactor biosynthesis protein LarB [Planctomycetota bacterium]|jgi:NCAIR mutase (PurE)-related protein